MKSAAELRLENLETLVKEAGSADALAKAAGMSAEYISQIRNRAIDKKTGKSRNLGNQAARRLEQGMSRPLGWMDTAHNRTAQGTAPTAKWPFERIDEDKVRALSPEELSAFEMAVLIAASQGGVDVKKPGSDES